MDLSQREGGRQALMTSIKDIARDVGCSISTVSRVINDGTAEDPLARKKVREAIERLEYVPDLTAQGLRVVGHA